MRIWIICLLSLFSINVVNASTLAYEKTAHFYSRVQHDPQALRIFIDKMPKGGLLHEHFWGGEFAENLIAMAQDKKFCVNAKTYGLSVMNERCPTYLRLSNARSQPDLYNNIINAWSMRHFIPTNQETAHHHFFNAFEKFYPINNALRGEILASEVNQAASEHVSYIELIVMKEMEAILKLANQLPKLVTPTDMQQALLKAGINKTVKAIREELDANEATMRKILQCDTPQAKPGCQVTVRYQYAAFRNSTPTQVFSTLLAGFILAEQDPRVVAINLVGPEDGYFAIHDYTKHMQWIKLLHQRYPHVQISLHAGELTQELVPPQVLRNHIKQAIEIAGAQRIGHGVDVAYEQDASKLLRAMRDQSIAVEINLTSNKLLLGITDLQSPLPVYLRHQVPIVLSRDDAGILRTDTNNEFATAAYTYNLSYATLKQFVNNSITYSFLTGKSLWKNSAKNIPVAECAHDKLGSEHPSASCQKLLSQSEKAALQWQVLAEFDQFEQQYV